SDGQQVFAEFSSGGPDYFVGAINITDGSTLVLDPSPSPVSQMVGVDDQNVYYVAAVTNSPQAFLWAVPKSGNAPPSIFGQFPVGTSVIMTKGNAYWVEQQATQSNIMTVPLTYIDHSDASVVPLKNASELDVSPQTISAMGVDDCGIVYATLDSATSSAIFQIGLR
ncbi:MAG: hypothetical protein ABI183_18565, partial [Polyangiaceae bacterium]